MRDDPRVAECHRIPITDVINWLGIENLRPSGSERVGPCPQCGGTDRFAVNPMRNVWNCRHCARGGDQIALVQLKLGMGFTAALEWLAGPGKALTQDQIDAQNRRNAEHQQRQDAVAARQRSKAIALAKDIWSAARPAEGTLVRDYLTARGITAELLPDMPNVIRFDPACRYTVDAGERGRFRTIHTGPAMIAAIQSPSGQLAAVHRTWLDLDREGGKARILDPDGIHVDLPSKKVLGSKKGGAIRLWSPTGSTRMTMGEGIETTLSGLVASGRPTDRAFWCGVDLGNMGGRSQRGPNMRYSGRPDMDDDRAFVPPSQISHLVFIQDGDSDPKLTRAKLECGLRRAKLHRPGLTTSIVHAGEGRDLNDLLRISE